jgi:hypothetical protein
MGHGVEAPAPWARTTMVLAVEVGGRESDRRVDQVSATSSRARMRSIAGRTAINVRSDVERVRRGGAAINDLGDLLF